MPRDGSAPIKKAGGMFLRKRLVLVMTFCLSSDAMVFSQQADPLSGFFPAMAERSLLVPGDTGRLQLAMQKAKEGAPLTIGFIGGSITAGANASNGSNRYTLRVTDWFQKQFPSSKVSYTGAGIGGTGSDFGAYRAQGDLLSKKPDVVFVEFSVNDSASAGAVFSMEALVRQILAAPNRPAVVMIGMLTQDGVNAQESHMPVARHYGIPYISIRDALWPEIERGNISWNHLFADNVHPNDNGHALVARLVAAFLDNVKAKPSQERSPEALPAALDSATDAFRNTRVANAGSDLTRGPILLVQNKGWTILKDSRHGPAWESSTGGSEISFEMNGTQLAMLVHKGKNLGIIEFSVDGGPFQFVSLYRGDGAQNNSALIQIGQFNAPGKHTVVVRHSEKANSESSGNRVELRMLLTAGFSAVKE